MKATPHCLCRPLLAVIIGIQAGCNRENAATRNKPVGSTNAALQAELDRLAESPPEHDPANRPLILSQPATNNRQWVIQVLRRGYRDTGRTNAAWDSQVGRAFEVFADYSRVSTTNWPSLQTALAAVPASCDEPMIQYMRVRYHEEAQPEGKTAADYLRVHEAMIRSKHHPILKFYAGMRAIQSARAADKGGTRDGLIAWTTAGLEDLARDTNAPVDEAFDAADAWLNHSHSQEWVRYVTANLEGILERNWGPTERWFRWHGDVEIRRAWGERGSGWASSVKEQAWEGFREHLDKAEEALTRAWAMNSNINQTAYLMMKVELGQGQGRARMETWFQRAMALNTNYYDAARQMSYYLEPRWYGSETKALAFARSCVASKQWGGNVPLVLVDVHHSLANYRQMSNAPAYWQRPEVWSDVKSSYEKFFALNPKDAGWRHDYAKDAYDCGQPAVFLQQTREFAFGTNYAFFGGKAKFEEMLEKAAASARGP